VLTDGRKVTKELFRTVFDQELEKIKVTIGSARFEKGKFDTARELFDKITTDEKFVEFLTLPGYEKLD
jgi:malate synthase